MPHHKQGRVTKVTNKDFPSDWKSLFVGRYVPACQKTYTPYFDKDDKLWKIIVFDTLKRKHLIYEFKTKSFREPLIHYGIK